AAAEQRRDRRELRSRELLVEVGKNGLQMLDGLLGAVEGEAPSLQARGDKLAKYVRVVPNKIIRGEDRSADSRHAITGESEVRKLGGLGLGLELIGVHSAEDRIDLPLQQRRYHGGHRHVDEGHVGFFEVVGFPE